MEQNQDLKALTDAFKGYRDMLAPVQESLKDMVETYESLHDDLQKLSADGGVHGKLDKIFETLSGQAKQSAALTQSVDAFLRSSEKYTSQISSVVTAFSGAQEKLTQIGELENKAREQLKRLDDIIEEKKISYNVKELQRSLETYNQNVQKVSDYINREVAQNLQNNSREIEKIRQENEKISSRLEEEHGELAVLVETLKGSNELLKKAVEKEDVNEAYVFEMLDRWADSRKVKIKK